MKICAVIAEFNPFHNGHKYLIDSIRRQGFSYIIAVMSGNFVQRGEPAVISKHARVHAALANGIDAVIEIPTIWAVSTAEKYAYAGVYLANAMGCIDALAFGSECGNIGHLHLLKESLSSEMFPEALKKHLSRGISFARARQYAVEDVLNKDILSSQIKSPNNILGVEYLKALGQLNSSIVPLTFERMKEKPAQFTSASKIRDIIACHDSKFQSYVPSSSYEIILNEINNFKAPVNFQNSERAILSKLRTMSLSDIRALPDVNEGLENRVYKSARSAASLHQLMFSIKTKRYTMSRIKRIITAAYLNITRDMQSCLPPYIRVLGAAASGFEVLKQLKKTCTLPVITRYCQILKFGSPTQQVFQHECLSADLYNLAAPHVQPCGSEQAFHLIKYN